MKIAHRKAQAEASRAFQASYFLVGFNDEYVSSLKPLRLSGVLGEIGLYVPKKGQPVNVSDEVSPPTYGTLDADSVCVETDQSPGELPRRKENAFLLWELPLVNTGF